MKILILGAGVIGTTTAHYLARDGHEVAIVERCSGAALETSFGNAGGLTPGLTRPWAGPGALPHIPGWLLRQDGAVRIKPMPDPSQWGWLLRFLANCRSDRYRRNRGTLQRIAHYSLLRLADLRAETGIIFDHQAKGVLQLFRTPASLDGAHAAAALLEQLGVPHRFVDQDEACRIEPALAQSSVSFAGGLHAPQDETGDCHLFTVALAKRLAGQGIVFHYDTVIERLIVDSGRIVGLATDHGILSADAYVAALGSMTPLLLRPLGISLPIYPVKGYGFTLPIERDADAPLASVLDEHTKLMVTRLGTRLRAAGIAEIGGYGRDADPGRCRYISSATAALFPRAADYGAIEYWTGLRPMTPDGSPYLGATPVRNLFLNAGHGSNGWTQACGSASVVADIIAGRKPEIDLSGLTLAGRFKNPLPLKRGRGSSLMRS